VTHKRAAFSPQKHRVEDAKRDRKERKRLKKLMSASERHCDARGRAPTFLIDVSGFVGTT
jgi:hypothetical protein